jgi:hypothetical protein
MNHFMRAMHHFLKENFMSLLVFILHNHQLFLVEINQGVVLLKNQFTNMLFLNVHHLIILIPLELNYLFKYAFKTTRDIFYLCFIDLS